ncbi:ThuA domain-containing protein [Candidatus Latescibacterota bacterium]
MKRINNLSRRSVLKTAAASLTGMALSVNPLLAAPKVPGEVRVIFLGGDYYHNPVTQEQTWRRVLGSTGWNLLFAQESKFVTPEVLADADLFVLTRYATDTQSTDLTLGWSPDKFVQDRPLPEPFMTAEQESMIIDNVKRGMGLIAVHCTIWNPDNKRFLGLLGASKSIMHTKVQPAHIHNLNQNHPITKDIEPFDIGDDEIFNAEMIPGRYVLLFNTSGEEQKIDAFGGWCREEGNGRVVALLPGHETGPWGRKPYKQIMWRSAHWAMKREIPTKEFIEGVNY